MKALVIGAGIGGLAAAIGLERIGVEVTIYERAAQLGEVGAGITLWANATRALAQLGAGAILGPISTPDIQAGIRASDGALLVGGQNDATRPGGAPLAVVMHRADLHAALLSQIDPARLHLNKALLSFDQDGAGVRAHFDDGTTAQADLLIGADGIGSRVRAQLHGDQPPRYAGYTAWRAVVPFDQARLLPGESWGSGARFGQIPLRDGRVYWFATKTAPQGQRSPDGERAELLRTFSGWHAPIGELIAAADERAILRHDICDRPPLARWGQGRVSLLGDAAHPMTPNLGQGACQAIEDAAVLQRCLSTGAEPAAALRRYEELRRPRTTAIVNQSRRVGAVGQWRSPLALRLRAWLLHKIAAPMQERQIASLVSYQF